MQRITVPVVVAALIALLAACSTAATEPRSAAPTVPAASQAVPAAESTSAGTPLPTRAPDPTRPPTTTVEPEAARNGLTLWHGFAENSPEEAIIAAQARPAASAEAAVPVGVLRVPADQLINRFETEAAAGGGPDLLIAADDTIGREARAGLLRALDAELEQAAFAPAALDAVRVDGKLYGVPITRATVALYANAGLIADPPTTTQALLDAAKGGTNIVLIRSAYHSYGLFGAFGGRLFDDTGRCIADQGGFADALAFMRELKNAGAEFVTDGAAAAEAFRSGQAALTIDGSWLLNDFRAALGDQLRVAPLPAGPAGPATPLIGGTSIVINANTQQPAAAVALALQLTNAAAQQQWAEQTRSLPANPDVALTDDALGGLAASALTGTPRPTRAELDAFWEPFDRALADVLETDVDPAQAVADACATMNANNGK